MHELLLIYHIYVSYLFLSKRLVTCHDILILFKLFFFHRHRHAHTYINTFVFCYLHSLFLYYLSILQRIYICVLWAAYYFIFVVPSNSLAVTENRDTNDTLIIHEMCCREIKYLLFHLSTYFLIQTRFLDNPYHAKSTCIRIILIF